MDHIAGKILCRENKQEGYVEDSLLVKGMSVDGKSPHPQKNQERLMVMGTPEDCGPEMVEAKVEVTSDGVHTVPPVRVKVDNTSKENRLSIPKQVAQVHLKNESSYKDKCTICLMQVRNMKVPVS